MKNDIVLISGASGFLGTALQYTLKECGYRVVSLVRTRPELEQDVVWWKPSDLQLDHEALEATSPRHVIHLAGEPVFGWPWTKAKKDLIMESRVQGTTLLAEALADLPRKPSTFISASGSGYYGDRGENAVSESDAPGEGFLATVCQAWEESTQPAVQAGIRTIQLRTGVVLSSEGGMLNQLLPFFKIGLGGRAGSGENYFPWITRNDWVRAVVFLLESDQIVGPVNMGSPNSVKSKILSQTLADILDRPHFLHQPDFLLKTFGGQMVEELVLTGRKMIPEKLLDHGFTFKHSELKDALESLLLTP